MTLEIVHQYISCDGRHIYLLDSPEAARITKNAIRKYGTTVATGAYQVLKYSDGYLYGCHGGELRWDSQVWQAIRQAIEQS